MTGADVAKRLMAEFADRTGLTSKRRQRRYLWTDAFAVCNFLGLGERELALKLIDSVHGVLSQHRPDDERTGWLDGASEEHPTRGGLRIGKPLPERREDERFNDRLEWERDGQYFHYLTRWMHALDRADLTSWARELMATAHRAFIRGGRLVWKMSIDLTRPLVPTTGQHDPLDGYLTAAQLGLAREQEAFSTLIRAGLWDTTDALGIGMLLCDALRAERLVACGALPDETLPRALLDAAGRSLEKRRPDPPWARLAFRELGLAIGLRAVPALDRDREADEIEAWCLATRGERAWVEHEDINDVMLATSLAPRGYLEISPRCSGASSV